MGINSHFGDTARLLIGSVRLKSFKVALRGTIKFYLPFSLCNAWLDMALLKLYEKVKCLVLVEHSFRAETT